MIKQASKVALFAVCVVHQLLCTATDEPISLGIMVSHVFASVPFTGYDEDNSP